MKQYVYFVSYRTESQFGRYHVIRDSEVTTIDEIDDIEEMELAIMAMGKTTSYPLVQFYQLMRTEDGISSTGG